MVNSRLGKYYMKSPEGLIKLIEMVSYNILSISLVSGVSYKNRSFSALLSRNFSPLFSINQIYDHEFSSRGFGKKGGEDCFFDV